MLISFLELTLWILQKTGFKTNQTEVIINDKNLIKVRKNREDEQAISEIYYSTRMIWVLPIKSYS